MFRNIAEILRQMRKAAVPRPPIFHARRPKSIYIGRSAAQSDSAAELSSRPEPESNRSPIIGPCASLVVKTTIIGACCRRTGADAYDRAITPDEAGPEPTTIIRTRSNPMEHVEQRVSPTLLPSYQAGRSRIIADVNHWAVCESGGADDGY